MPRVVQRDGSAEDEVKRMECVRIQADIDAIDARMRSAYRSPEGEMLRERRHKLKDVFYEFRCLKR